MSVETTQQIIDFAKELIDETLDDTLAVNLAENAKNLIEGDRAWLMLMKEDSSKTVTPSNNYLVGNDLPDDFLEDYKVVLGDSSNNDFIEYNSIRYEDRRIFNDSGPRYYIDWANQKIHITGTIAKTYTIYLNYIYQTPALDLSGSNPVWPKKFRVLISYMMSALYQLGIDYDDITARQAIAKDQQGKLLFETMITWDARLKLKAINESVIDNTQNTALITDRVQFE